MIRATSIPFVGADVVSELAIKIIQKFSFWHCRQIRQQSIRIPAAFVLRNTTKAIGSSLSFGSKTSLVRPVHSLAQRTQCIERAIQLVARKTAQVQHSIGAQSIRQAQGQTDPVVDIHLCPVWHQSAGSQSQSLGEQNLQTWASGQKKDQALVPLSAGCRARSLSISRSGADGVLERLVKIDEMGSGSMGCCGS